METDVREKFKTGLIACMPQLIKETLLLFPEQKVYGISFLTTDDFYGMYMAFHTKENMAKEADDKEYMRWVPTEWPFSSSDLPTQFNQELYSNLVEIIDANLSIDFTRPSKEKWSFALFLIEAINEAVCLLPDDFFRVLGYEKQEIIFSVTMSDGDYMEEMLIESIKKMNDKLVAEEVLSALEN